MTCEGGKLEQVDWKDSTWGNPSRQIQRISEKVIKPDQWKLNSTESNYNSWNQRRELNEEPNSSDRNQLSSGFVPTERNREPNLDSWLMTLHNFGGTESEKEGNLDNKNQQEHTKLCPLGMGSRLVKTWEPQWRKVVQCDFAFRKADKLRTW